MEAQVSSAQNRPTETLFPAIVHSPLWNKEDIARLDTGLGSRGQSRTDKQAAKIADYVQLYGALAPLSRQTFTAKSTAPTVKIEDLGIRVSHKHTSSFIPTSQNTSGRLGLKPPIEFRNISKTAREMETLRKEAEALGYELQKAASDKAELTRDLATYEHLFSQKVNLNERLLKLRSHASTLPSIFESLERSSDHDRDVYKEIKAGLTVIEKLDHETVQSAEIQTAGLTSFDLRPTNDALASRQLYRGAVSISHIPTLVSVFGNGLFRDLQIRVLTLSGSLFKLSVRQDLLEKQNIKTSRHLQKAIKSLILPHLYFQSRDTEMKLQFDLECSVSFLTLIVEVKGSEEALVTAKLSENEEEVQIDLSIGNQPVIVKKREVTKGSSIFCDSQQSLAMQLTRHLFNSSEGLLWLPSPKPKTLFHSREVNSRFLNDDYLSDTFQILNFQNTSTDRFSFEGMVIKVETLAHKELTRMRLSHEEKTFELDLSSHELRFLLSLQTLDLRTSRFTILQTLEFQTLLRSLFSE